MILKKIPLLAFASLIAFGGPVFAQAVEAVPLSAPSYTLQGETDPMAMDPSATPLEKSVNRGEAIPAAPPPGADDQPGSSTDATVGGYDATPSPTHPPSDFSASSAAPPAVMDSERTQQAYPNNPVSGVVKTDENKFENRTFCTLKVSFSSRGGIDRKTADKVKTYLDNNTEKLTYRKTTWGRHGEFDYCIDIPTHNYRARIYSDLKKMLPLKETRDRRTMLTGKGFMQVQNAD